VSHLNQGPLNLHQVRPHHLAQIWDFLAEIVSSLLETITIKLQTYGGWGVFDQHGTPAHYSETRPSVSYEPSDGLSQDEPFGYHPILN